ncbi:MAG: nucleotidyltransferase family protein [Lewinellaceae bacterium]|nr:nucleotidyltransferase family protein [Saprospiraceae bacterium]MCB9337968.1 nucleotidyltransferase family protein [Lewinellaceae bacterium]
MTRAETIKAIKQYFSQYPVKQVGVFGSFARQEENEKSDIDILVNFKETIDLFTYVNIIQELSERLGRKVDLVTDKGLYPALKENILKDLQIIAEA